MSASTDPSLSSIYVPLRLTYGLIPLLAGMDKFLNILTDWQAYLPSVVANALPIAPATFMMVVGVIEIIAGLAVLTSLTRLGAYVVMVWLILIAIAVTLGGHYDIAVRDVAMAIGAFTLGQVAAMRGEQWIPSLGKVEGTETHATAH